MAKKQEEELIYRRNSVEFVTVAAEYCSYLEQNPLPPRRLFSSQMLRILPLLYLKAAQVEADGGLTPINEEEDLAHAVTEEIYEDLRGRIAERIGADDVYLDVFLEDMKYSDKPISRTISEDLADIYQDLGDFISSFRSARKETMNDALCLCLENFRLYWGQRLLGALRALHQVCHETQEDDRDQEPNQ